jgi:hypothetical protein
MKPRFRVRTRDGRELEPQNLEVLAELIRSGSVQPEDLVFDAVTCEWAPARAHSVVRMFSHGDAEPESEAPPEASAVAGPGASGLDLTLVEPQEATSDEETESFIARLEEERRRDEEGDADPVPLETPLLADSGVVEGLEVPIAALAPSEPIPADLPVPTQVGVPEGRHPYEPRGPDSAEHRPEARAPSTRPVPPRRSKGPWSRWLSESWALAVVLPLVAVAVSAALARPPAPVSSEATPPRTSTEDPAPSTSGRLLPPGEEGIRQEAHSSFLEALIDLGTEFDVEQVPPDWLEGWYLAHPSSYPEVRSFWERFLDYAEEAYATEVLLYREAYLRKAADAGMNGPVRSLRMAAAVEDFEAGRSDREVHYARVWELAISSLALHDQLVQMEGRITYEPARGQRLSADPVLEAAGRDEEAQGRLEVALDRVLRDLRGPDGAGVSDRSLVTTWLVDGFRPAGSGGG